MLTAPLALALALGLGASSRIAVMPVGSGEGVPGRTAEAVTEAVAAEVRRYGGAEVITQKEIVAVLSLEQQKQMLGCQSDSCMAELGGALGVDRMISGDLARLGESWLFHLKLVDVVKVKVIAQSDRRLRRGSIDDVLDVLPAMVVELFPPPSRPAPPQAAQAPPATSPDAVSPPATSAPPAEATAPQPAGAVTAEATWSPPGASGAALSQEPLPPPTAPMPRPEKARKVARPWVESSIAVPLAERRDLAVYTDDRGLFIAAAPFEEGRRRVFAGDAEKLFAQEVLGAGAKGSSAHAFTFWDPRASSPAEALFEVRAGKARLFCGARERPLRTLSRGEADRVLASATFYGPRWRREPHVLARDDEGNFFYVDRARAGTERGGADYRLYAGPLGKLTRLELADVAEEPDGLVLVTAAGKLRLGHGPAGTATADWLAGGGRRVLRPLDPARSGALVYRQLGVYKGDRLGTPCDGAME